VHRHQLALAAGRRRSGTTVPEVPKTPDCQPASLSTKKAGALIRRRPVAKLFQNPQVLTRLGICFERKQMPRFVGNLRKSLNAKEAREAVRIRPRQVRYQAALRPDSTSENTTWTNRTPA
jgi:hypothetical protein